MQLPIHALRSLACRPALVSVTSHAALKWTHRAGLGPIPKDEKAYVTGAIRRAALCASSGGGNIPARHVGLRPDNHLRCLRSNTGHWVSVQGVRNNHRDTKANKEGDASATQAAARPHIEE